MALERLDRSAIYGSISPASPWLHGTQCFHSKLNLTAILLPFRKPLAHLILLLSVLMTVRVHSNALISLDDLEQKIRLSTNLLILDIRPRVRYQLLGHIPGAHNIWRPAFQADEHDYPFSGMRASRQKLSQLLSQLGATPETEIILYDDQQGMNAARLWWLLKLYGHDRASILNGGLSAWENHKKKLNFKSPETPKQSQYQFTGTPHPQWLAEIEQVKSIQTKKENALLVDVRSLDEFTGKTRKSGAYRHGRIPGSIWFEYKQTVNENGFLDKERLRRLFQSAGITPDKEIIVYCQSGVRSAHTLFVLSELLGYNRIKNYDGSWIEWSWMRELPAVQGPPKKNR